jgi:D-xylose transport system substrate-binding protein
MKRVLFLMVAVLLVGIVSNGVLAADVTVGFLIKTMQEERYQTDRDIFFEEAEKLGAEVIFEAADNNADLQFAKFENMLTKGVDVIVVQPVDPEAASNMVKIAHEEGVRIVAYDMVILNSDLDLFVTPDGWQVGVLQGQEMVKWFMENRGEVKGKVVLLRGTPGCSNIPLFTQGVLDTLAENPGLELVVDQYHLDWSPDLAMATTENALTKYGNDIDAVISNNSGMASGAVRALEAQGLADTTKVFVAGSDADLINMRYIVQGKQTMDVFKKIKPLAQRAAQVAVEMAKNPNKGIEELFEISRTIDNGYKEVPVIVTPIVAVTKDNIMDTVVADGYHSAEEIYD